MKEPKRYCSEVRGASEHGDDPAWVEVFIDQATAERIVELCETVNALGAYSMQDWNYSADWYMSPKSYYEEMEDGDTYPPKSFEGVEPERTECDRLGVTSTEFWFACYPKNCDNEIKSTGWKVQELVDYFGLPFALNKPV